MAPKWSPKGSRNRAKIDKKTIRKSIEILVGLLKGLGSVFDQFWERFGDPGPSKMNVSCRRGAIFKIVLFIRVDFFVRLEGFGVVWGGMLGAMGDQHGFKIKFEKRKILGSLLEALRGAKWRNNLSSAAR